MASVVSSAAVRIDVTGWLQRRARRIAWAYRLSPLLGLLLGLPLAPLWQVMSWWSFGLLLAATALMSRGIAWLSLSDSARAVALSLKGEGRVAAGPEGLRAPLSCFGEPTLHRGAALGLVDVTLPWSEIVRVTLRPGPMPTGGHLLFEVDGGAVSLASTAPSLLGLERPYLALVRAPVRDGEARLLEALAAHLSEPVRVDGN